MRNKNKLINFFVCKGADVKLNFKMKESKNNSIKNLIDGYLKFRDGIPPINEQEKDFISSAKEELNDFLKGDKLDRAKKNISCFVESIFKRDENLNYNIEYPADIINHISNEIYVSFSSYSASCNVPRLSIESALKYPQLQELLENLCRNIHQKSTATEIIDLIEDEFEKLKKIGLS